MTHERRDELLPDPRLTTALREAVGEPPFEEVDWVGLRRSIAERAELPLARRRRRRWGGRIRRAGPLVPLAVAASVGLAVWLAGGRGSGGGGSLALEATPPASVSVEEALHAPELSEQEFQLLISGRANPEALLLIAVGER